MFYRDASNQYIQNGVSFEIDGTQYPANWLNCSTPEEKAQLGLVEVVNSNSPENDQFYWVSYSLDKAVGTYTNTPKNLDDLKKQWVASTNNTCYQMMLPSDWMVVKQTETGQPMPADWNNWRASMRTTAANARTAILAATSIPELEAVVVVDWPPNPDYVVPVVVQPTVGGVV